MRLAVALLGLVAFAATPKARAQEAAPGPVAVAAKVGVVLPQVATELGTALGGELEIGFRLPVAGGRLALFTAVGYTQPKVERTDQADPRLPGPFDGTQTQRELVAGLGGLYRFAAPASVWNGYAALSVRAYFLETISVGEAGGAEFGENREQSTEIGGALAIGGERRLGPGAATLELQYGMSKLSHLITGDVSTGAVAALVGFRFFF